MILGLDYWNVISQFPSQCWDLAWKCYINGGTVYIVSAVGEKRLKESGGIEGYRDEINSFNIPNSEIILVEFKDQSEIPELKYAVCKEKGIDLFLDDRPETIEYLHSKGIMAALVPKPLKKIPQEKVET